MNTKELQALERVTEGGIKHGLTNYMANSVSKQEFKDPKMKEKVEKQKAHDGEIIKARYINRKETNGKLSKSYMKYAGEPLTQWLFLSNEVYDVYRGLVEEVNSAHLKIKKRSDLLDKDGKALECDQPADIEHEFVGVI